MFQIPPDISATQQDQIPISIQNRSDKQDSSDEVRAN